LNTSAARKSGCNQQHKSRQEKALIGHGWPHVDLVFETGLSISGAASFIEHLIRITDLVPVLGDESKSISETRKMMTAKARMEQSMVILRAGFQC
jgi:hypothetical protein